MTAYPQGYGMLYSVYPNLETRTEYAASPVTSEYFQKCWERRLENKGELAGTRLLTAKTVDLMTANSLSDAIVQQRGDGMGWGLANVEVVLEPAALKYPANRGEYGWNGSAGTYFWIDPGTETITILMTQYADSLPGQFKTLVQQAIQ